MGIYIVVMYVALRGHPGHGALDPAANPTTAELLKPFWMPPLGFGLAYLVSQALYGLAVLAELVWRPDNANRFRAVAYLSIFWCARVLPILVLVVWFRL